MNGIEKNLLKQNSTILKTFLKLSQKTKFCGVEKDPRVTVSGLKK